MRKVQDPVLRFFSYVKYSDDCWEWTGGLFGNDPRYSYGSFKDVKQVRAHRWSYEFFVGPLGKKLCCHHCDNKKCVNPFHLFKGTHKDNARDMVSKGRHRCQIKTHCVNGHPLSGDNLFRNKYGSRRCRTCERNEGKKKRLKMKEERETKGE